MYEKRQTGHGRVFRYKGQDKIISIWKKILRYKKENERFKTEVKTANWTNVAVVTLM